MLGRLWAMYQLVELDTHTDTDKKNVVSVLSPEVLAFCYVA